MTQIAPALVPATTFSFCLFILGQLYIVCAGIVP